MNAPRIKRLSRILVVPSLLILTACGGSNGSGNPATASASIDFPPDGSMVDAQMVTVSGTASDRDDVLSVRVNGVEASSMDNFSSWSVDLPVSRGANTVTVELTDGDNNIHDNLDSVQIQNELFSFFISTFALDEENNRLLVVDDMHRAIVAVDLDSGQRELFSPSTFSPMPNAFVRPSAILVDGANNRALVLDSGIGILVAVDLTTGDRSIISDNSAPNADNPINFLAATMTLDSLNNRILVVQNPVALIGSTLPPMPPQVPQIIAIDLSSGERTIFSDDETPNDEQGFIAPTLIAFDSNQNRVLVVDRDDVDMSEEILLSLNPLDGQRSIFSDVVASGGSDPFRSISGIAVDAVNNRVLLLQFDFSVISVDLSSGERSLLFDAPPFSNNPVVRFGFINPPNGIDINSNGDTLYSARSNEALIESIDLNSGARAPLSVFSHVPDGNNKMDSPMGMVFDTKNNNLLVVNGGNNRVINVDPDTGSRNISYENTTPNSYITAGLSGFDYGADSGQVYFFESRAALAPPNPVTFTDSLVAVDPISGARTVISVDDDGQAVEFDRPSAVIADEEASMIYLLDESGILSVNLNNGEREVFVVEPLITSTPSFFDDRFTGLILDKDDNRLLATNFFGDLLAIDLDNKLQTLVSMVPIVGASAAISIDYPLLLDRKRNRVLRVNIREVEAIDLSTGERSILSGDNFLSTDTPFFNVGDLVLDDQTDTIFALDRILSAVYRIDPEDGRAAIISR